jgi:hypothetical protein
MNKRHAKPTSAQLAARTYRHVLRLNERMEDYIATGDAIQAIERTLHGLLFDSKEAREDNLPTLPALQREMGALTSGQEMFSHRLESLRVIADHCNRLLKEKETLQRMVQTMKDASALVSRWAPSPSITPHGGVPTVYTRTYVCGCSAVSTDGPLLAECPTHSPDFQSARHGECAFALTHREGIRCGVCGE